MVLMPGGWLRATQQALGAALAFGFASGFLAQENGQDAASVAALLHEAADRIHATAYRTEPRAVICTKALRGLVAQLGESARVHDRDLSTMQDDAAEAELVRILQKIAATPGQRFGLRELAERAIQAWCKQHDPYTRYTRSDDVRLVQLMMSKATGSGVGVTVLEKAGAFQAYPLPGSPAEA